MEEYITIFLSHIGLFLVNHNHCNLRIVFLRDFLERHQCQIHLGFPKLHTLYKGNQTRGHFQVHNQKLMFSNFLQMGLNVLVLVVLQTPILTYSMYVMYHLSSLTYDILFNPGNICHMPNMTYDKTNIGANRTIRTSVNIHTPNLKTIKTFLFNRKLAFFSYF